MEKYTWKDMQIKEIYGNILYQSWKTDGNLWKYNQAKCGFRHGHSGNTKGVSEDGGALFLHKLKWGVEHATSRMYFA